MSWQDILSVDALNFSDKNERFSIRWNKNSSETAL